MLDRSVASKQAVPPSNAAHNNIQRRSKGHWKTKRFEHALSVCQDFGPMYSERSPNEEAYTIPTRRTGKEKAETKTVPNKKHFTNLVEVSTAQTCRSS